MTAPLFLLPAGALEGVGPGAAVLVDGPEGRHAQTVKRLTVGEAVLLTDGSGLRVAGTVSATAPGELTVLVDGVEQEPQPLPRLVLVQALAKGDRDDQAIEAATELGVDEVVPWQASRSIVQWKGERGAKAHRKWEQVVVAATKQSRRSRTPLVAPLATTKDLVARAAAGARVVVLHEDATTSVNEVDLTGDADVLLVVGPEGGISPEELGALEAVGGVVTRLGPHVLRSSSAGPAALAVLLARLRW